MWEYFESSFLCCTSSREGDQDVQPVLRNRQNSWIDLPETEEFQEFFDCFSTEEELRQGQGQASRDAASWRSGNGGCFQVTPTCKKSQLPRKVPLCRTYSRQSSIDGDDNRLAGFVSPQGNRTMTMSPAEAKKAMGPGTCSVLDQRNVSLDFPGVIIPSLALLPEDVHEHLVPVVEQEVRRIWRERISSGELDDDLRDKIKQEFPELEEWTNIETVRRMLRASGGNHEQSIRMLAKAIETRVHERDLFRAMKCKVACDMRIIGRDNMNRPTIYLCARSQTEPIRDMIPQVFLAFEAASKLAQADGQSILIADMHRFSPMMNADPFAIKDLAECFGVVYADRLNFIMMVDFSFIAQGVWTLCKAVLSERTQKKICFVSEAKARAMCEEKIGGPTCERILSAFDINRDTSATDEEREAHAHRTAICDVPLGVLRPADEVS